MEFLFLFFGVINKTPKELGVASFLVCFQMINISCTPLKRGLETNEGTPGEGLPRFIYTFEFLTLKTPFSLPHLTPSLEFQKFVVVAIFLFEQFPLDCNEGL